MEFKRRPSHYLPPWPLHQGRRWGCLPALLSPSRVLSLDLFSLYHMSRTSVKGESVGDGLRVKDKRAQALRGQWFKFLSGAGRGPGPQSHSLSARLIPCPPQQMDLQQQKERLNKMPLLRGTRAREEGVQGGRTLTQPFPGVWLSRGPGIRKNLRDLHVLGAVAV